ncbi:MAG: peptidase M16 [Bacteroidetes bacterium CG23_combo_of_CG06-09_8_20_14_all_32_9]|nr:MAG: peptidase M16 [Bacteroidetes bacterium CG23_combo_of_CG06-09_8_20_14_all_32_9]
MIVFDRFVLNNELRIIVHRDKTTPLAAVNILYQVGARNENPERTGFAHLFEHLMFGGSANIPCYDEPLQWVGGENNAFTTNDITNYHLTLPAENIETAFWLESDRMLSLAFTEKSLEVQRSVVIEEFRQRYLNQPYGDVWLHLRPLAYKVHPYRWATIGISEKHIAEATMKDVKDFFFSWYAPNNAIMVVAGNVQTHEIIKLSQKWFGGIPKRNISKIKILQEPEQTKTRRLVLERPVPMDALYIAFQMPGRMHNDYKPLDIISDLLGNGKSSRLFRTLVMEKKIFGDIEAYITGSIDTGLLIVEGRLNPGISFESSENAVFEILNELSLNLTETELQKVKNKAEAALIFNYMDILNKATSLAFFEMMGDASLINSELEGYQKVTLKDIKVLSKKYIRKENASILYYKSITK